MSVTVLVCIQGVSTKILITHLNLNVLWKPLEIFLVHSVFFLVYNYFSNMVCNFLMERITKFVFKCSVEFFVMEYMNTIEYFVFVGGAAYYTEYMGLF